MAELDLNMLSTSDLGYTVDDEDDDDPVLLDQDGNPVETWRERYPYDERMPRSQYKREKRLLQIELLKLQRWTKRTGARHVILFEGRDAAGKGVGRTPAARKGHPSRPRPGRAIRATRLPRRASRIPRSIAHFFCGQQGQAGRHLHLRPHRRHKEATRPLSPP